MRTTTIWQHFFLGNCFLAGDSGVPEMFSFVIMAMPDFARALTCALDRHDQQQWVCVVCVCVCVCVRERERERERESERERGCERAGKVENSPYFAKASSPSSHCHKRRHCLLLPGRSQSLPGSSSSGKNHR